MAGQGAAGIRGTGFCVEALEAALWAVGGADCFVDAVLRAANLGDDADTTAAIAGQLAGARWGASAIPAAWRRQVTLGERIVELATGLFRAGAAATPRRMSGRTTSRCTPGGSSRDVLAGEYPGDSTRHVAVARVNLLIDAGVRTFVDLTAAAAA